MVLGAVAVAAVAAARPVLHAGPTAAAEPHSRLAALLGRAVRWSTSGGPGAVDRAVSRYGWAM